MASVPCKLLINYRGKAGMPGVGGNGIDTGLETINRWVPSSENDTQGYAAVVVKRLGVRARTRSTSKTQPRCARWCSVSSSMRAAVTCIR